MPIEKRWVVKPQGDSEAVAKLASVLRISPVLANLLVQRGIDTVEKADKFFKPSLADLHDPFLMKDMDKAVERVLICDWRSPVAGLFYDCEVGPAGYDAPVGRVEGTLTRKRQFKIRGGEMEYALETSDNIRDDVLQRELSRTSDEKMKSIIATIQREQNRIIRSERTGTMIIQGVAGSGKTSIALHRLAFLLYRHKDTLSAGLTMFSHWHIIYVSSTL